jgi:hypothetical protein
MVRVFHQDDMVDLILITRRFRLARNSLQAILNLTFYITSAVLLFHVQYSAVFLSQHQKKKART